MIEVKNLTMHYRAYVKDPGFMGSVRSLFNRRKVIIPAVDNVSFNIEQGEMIGFIGANGAGKTTTLKLLSGLLYPTSGTVTVGGFTPQHRKPEFLRSISLVMGQKMQLMWDLSAADSFLVNKAIYDISDDAYQQRLTELADMLEAGDLLNRQIRRLSLGERMKCELIAALLHQPKVLFLDEPTIGLDVNMQLAVREFIARYNERYQATVILTSHYMADVAVLADRIIIIDRGRFIYDGSLETLVERFAPQKTLRIQLSTPVPAETLAQYGEARDLGELEAAIVVDRKRVTEIAARLLTELPITDIAIEEPSIEDVVRQVFTNASGAPNGERMIA